MTSVPVSRLAGQIAALGHPPRGRQSPTKEYDRYPYTPGVRRGPDRIVIGSDGSRYFTSDHYETFVKF